LASIGVAADAQSGAQSKGKMAIRIQRSERGRLSRTDLLPVKQSVRETARNGFLQAVYR
jgi:hypothetical protein